MTDSTAVQDALDEAGYRLTEARRSIADLIAARNGHFTAADLVADARARRLGIGRATIFRTLDVLVDLQAVERLDLPTGDHAYVACERAHHHHVVCSNCGASRDIDDAGWRAVVRDIERRTGYRIDDHRLELFGVCPDCTRSRPVTEARPTLRLDSSSRPLFAALALIALVLAACSPGTASQAPAADALRVVATTTVFADIVSAIGGAHVTVDSIVPAGSGPEDYEPRPADARKISEAELIVSNGVGLDDFLTGIIDAAGSATAERLVLGDGIPTITIDGEENPHFWLDPSLVEQYYVPAIRDTLTRLDPLGQDRHRSVGDGVCRLAPRTRRDEPRRSWPSSRPSIASSSPSTTPSRISRRTTTSSSSA